MYTTLGLIGSQLLAGFLTNSLALYSEAGHSSVDMLAALISYVAVSTAGRPPDREHLFGHAKFESMGALVQLLFLFGLGAAIVYSALERLLFRAPPITITPVAALLIVITLAVETWRTVSLLRAARRFGSETLAASALHFFSDLLGTIVVIIGLAFTALGFPKADAIAALGIAALVFLLSFRLGKRVLHSLTDRAPAGIVEHVEGVVLSVTDVIDVHDIRIRQAGSQYFTEMHVSLSPQITLERAHDVLDKIEHELHAHYPSMHVVTHPEPWET